MRRGDDRSSSQRSEDRKLAKERFQAKTAADIAEANYYQSKVAQPLSAGDKLLAQQNQMAQTDFIKAQTEGLSQKNWQDWWSGLNKFTPSLGQQRDEYNAFLQNAIEKGKADVDKIKADSSLARGSAAQAHSQGELARQQAEQERQVSEIFRNDPGALRRSLKIAPEEAPPAEAIATPVVAGKPEVAPISLPARSSKRYKRRPSLTGIMTNTAPLEFEPYDLYNELSSYM